LTPSGAAVLLGCALWLGVVEALVGEPGRPLPDLPILAAVALLPLAMATRIVSAPGVASAVCGAYLLPRSFVSLLQPGVEPPPLLLVPALAFDLVLWVRADDVSRLVNAWKGREQRWRKRAAPVVRQPTRWRAAAAGAVFGLVLALVEPPFAVFLGADPATWSGGDRWIGAAAALLVAAVIGIVSARGTAS
jgi:hypothetical protein